MRRRACKVLYNKPTSQLWRCLEVPLTSVLTFLLIFMPSFVCAMKDMIFITDKMDYVVSPKMLNAKKIEEEEKQKLIT